MRESAQKMTLSSLPCSWSKISFLSRAEHRLRCANCSGCFDQCRNRCEPAPHKPRPSQTPTAPRRCRWLQPQPQRSRVCGRRRAILRAVCFAQPRPCDVMRTQSASSRTVYSRAPLCAASALRAGRAAGCCALAPSGRSAQPQRSKTPTTVTHSARRHLPHAARRFGMMAIMQPFLRLAWDGCINVRVFLAG